MAGGWHFTDTKNLYFIRVFFNLPPCHPLTPLSLYYPIGIYTLIIRYIYIKRGGRDGKYLNHLILYDFFDCHPLLVEGGKRGGNFVFSVFFPKISLYYICFSLPPPVCIYSKWISCLFFSK